VPCRRADHFLHKTDFERLIDLVRARAESSLSAPPQRSQFHDHEFVGVTLCNFGQEQRHRLALVMD
jgi:hypothetical protein